MKLSQVIISFILQSQPMGTTAVNKKFHNKVKGKDGYVPDKICGLKTKVGISAHGDTRPRVPYIALLAEGQSVKSGFYPVLLYYRENDELILSYGLSATNEPATSWDFNSIGINKPLTIGNYYKDTPHDNKYDSSYVDKIYCLNNIVNELKDIDTTDDQTFASINIGGVDIDSLFSIESDINEIVTHYSQQLSNDINPTSATSIKGKSQITMDISVIINLISQTGLQYSSELIKRFAFALMTKPFVILSGLAGSGKTQLALAFAKSLIKDKSQMCTVAVGADWTNREPLLGYPNALTKGEYVLPDSKVLQLLIEANKEGNHNKPYFLILDEMNMSYVERYFADFLSVIESHEEIQLWNAPAGSEVPSSLSFPSNLFIIGTINVDETTYMFSPKVLDRANVIEFKISEDEMDSFLSNIRDVDITRIFGQASEMAADFVAKSCSPTSNSNLTIKDTLVSFFSQLKSVNAEFGYRSATEIYRFYEIAKTNDDESDPMTDDQILDCAIVQKILPKLHGSRKKLSPVLKQLWSLCGTDKQLDDAKSVPDGIRYPLSADKILRMYQAAVDNGFTSFSEA